MQETDTIVKDAIELAQSWQNRANALMTQRERSRYNQLARLQSDPRNKILLTQLIDQSFRSRNYRRVADQIYYLLCKYGIPDFFSDFEKLHWLAIVMWISLF